MRHFLSVLILVSSCVLVGPAPLAAQVPQEIPLDSVLRFLKFPPGIYLGEAAGMAMNSKGHIFVYSRSGGGTGHIIAPQAAQIWEFGPDGSFIRELGQNLYSKAWAHACASTEDNIWLVDNGSDMVVKLSPDGDEVLLVLGRRRETVASVEVRPAVPEGTPTRPARARVQRAH